MLCKSYKPLSYHVIQALFDNPGDVQEAKRCVSLIASLQVLHDLVSHDLPLASFEVRFCFTKLQNIFKKHSHKTTCITSHQDSTASFLINTNEDINYLQLCFQHSQNIHKNPETTSHMFGLTICPFWSLHPLFPFGLCLVSDACDSKDLT